MAITLSPEHEAARLEACRLPALQATLARLVATLPDHSTLTLYDHADPADPAAAALVAIPLSDTVGTIDDAQHRLVIDTPIEALVDGADPSNGSTPLSARLTGPTGAWEMDLSVSEAGGGGDIIIDTAALQNGATARITDAVIQG